MTKVFISYSHDSAEHTDKVLELADRLVGDGIDCILDQYEQSPAEGWPRWMDNHIRDADWVLMICTERYFKRATGKEKPGKGRGVKWEANLTYQHLYDDDTKNDRVVPVLFDAEDEKFVPTPVKGATYYCVDSEEGYENLYRRLTGQPEVVKPELGEIRKLPAKSGVGKAMHPLEEENRLENAFAIGVVGDETDGLAGDVSDRSSQRERLIDSAARMEERVDSAAVLQNVAQKYGGGAELASSEYMPMVDMPQLVERASMRNETIGELLKAVGKYVWTAINGECGCGKTQLAVLLAMKHNKLGGWLGLRDYKEAGVKLDAACTVWSGRALGTNRRDFYSAVCKHFAPGSMLIIDDMPKLDGSDELSARLALLGEACRANNIKLVSTSNFELPTQLMAQIGSASVANIGVPPFNNADAKGLFEAYGAPVHILTDACISFFVVLARHNATLLAAMARYLESRNWQYTKEEFGDLVKGSYADKVDEETVTKFVKTVEDPDSRGLLYRLRLTLFNFAREDVKAVAGVEPTIQRPLEKLVVS